MTQLPHRAARYACSMITAGQPSAATQAWNATVAATIGSPAPARAGGRAHRVRDI